MNTAVHGMQPTASGTALRALRQSPSHASAATSSAAAASIVQCPESLAISQSITFAPFPSYLPMLQRKNALDPQGVTVP